MKYHQIRNATCVLELGGQRILVDPMLGAPGTLPPYTLFRYKARRNPLTPLPDDWQSTLEGVDACLISHVHFGVNCDHLDQAGSVWLSERRIPTWCRPGDEKALRKRNLDVFPVGSTPQAFLSGMIHTVRASHGRGLIGAAMGPGVGYLLEFPGEPVVYLTGDTVLTDSVLDVLETRAPDVCIVPGGGARLDVGGPILMSLDELHEFVESASGHVLINHLGALNHCPHTPEDIKSRLGENLSARVTMPVDGESVVFPAKKAPSDSSRLSG